MSTAVIKPDSFIPLFSEAPPLDDDIYNELRSQLQRKLMTYLPGIPMNPAIAIELYANSIQGVGRINVANTRMDGSPNNNPCNFGNVYEEQEVTAFNREQIIAGSSLRAERTDNLADNRFTDSSMGDLGSYAMKHHEHVDMVSFDERTGRVTKTYQVKHTRGSNILAKEAYTSHEDAPDSILTPTDMKDRHQEKLDRISQKAHSEENRNNASIAKDKLEAGHVDSLWTGNPDKDNHHFLHKVVQDNPTVGKALPYIHQGMVMSSDAITRVGGRLALDGAAILMGGTLFEIKDAYENPGNLSFTERIRRILDTLFLRMQELIKEKGLKEISLEAATAIFGLVTGMFKNLRALFKTLGTALNQITDQVWNFLTGKTSSFAEFSANCLKVLSAVAVSTCAFAAEEYLSAAFPWLPRIISGMASVAVAGVAIVFINRGIDLAIGTLVAMFSEAKAARMHREQVEAYIADTLPGILEEAGRIDAYASKYLENMAAQHNLSFAQISTSFYADSEQFRQTLNSHAAVMGVKEIGDDFLDDLESELMDFAAKKHG